MRRKTSSKLIELNAPIVEEIRAIKESTPSGDTGESGPVSDITKGW